MGSEPDGVAPKQHGKFKQLLTAPPPGDTQKTESPEELRDELVLKLSSTEFRELSAGNLSTAWSRPRKRQAGRPSSRASIDLPLKLGVGAGDENVDAEVAGIA